jgi:16S rRNA processing protein RimM
VKKLQDKIYVAKLGKSIGLKGEQKLHIDSDFPEQFKPNATFTTDKNQILTIQSYNQKNNTVKFKEINSVEEAKKITNRQLFVSYDDTKKLCNLEEKQFFWFDIVGCSIKQDDEILGVVTDIQRMPLSDYLYIKTSKEFTDKKMPNSFLLPYIDNYIQKVDIENKIIFAINAKDILETS